MATGGGAEEAGELPLHETLRGSGGVRLLMFAPMTPWVQRILIANVLMFFLTNVPNQGGAFGLNPGSPFVQWLAYYPPRAIFTPWTAITYMFLHDGIRHIVFNMVGVFFFAPRLETKLGGGRFLWFYLLSGIGGALLQTVFVPSSFMVGASGGVYAIIIGFAYFWPRETIVLFPIPVPIQARFVAIGYVVISLLGGFGGGGGGIAHFAHLGGAAAGFVFLKFIERRQGAAKRSFQKKMRPDAKSGGFMGDRMANARWKGISIDSLHELNREEVRRLLDKVKGEGAASLTDSEREFLDRMAGG